jgi:hypothetical protein
VQAPEHALGDLQRRALVELGSAWSRVTVFFFKPFFPKDSLKYAPGENISKNRPLSWRHSRRRKDITA